MTISIVLRLIESALAEGRVAGEAEIVRTGERAVVKDEQCLLAFLRSHHTGSESGSTADVNDEE